MMLCSTGSKDNTLCLWTVMGEKMGTFGEPEGWKLTPKLHDYARVAELAVHALSRPPSLHYLCISASQA